MNIDLPMLLLPYQRAWVEDQSRVRIVEKSRRIGLSWTVALELVLDACRANGCDGWYVGYNKDMSQEFIRDCAFWARALDVAASSVEESIFVDDGSDKEILTFTIRFKSGFRITSLSSRPTNLRYKKGRIVLDEAAHHDNLKELLKAAMALLMWGGSSRIDIISTHNGIDNTFNKVLEECRAGKRDYSVHRITLDEALEQGLYKRICEVNGEKWSKAKEAKWRKDLFTWYADGADEELRCIPSKSGGTYISHDLVERRMRPGHVVRFEAPKDFLAWDGRARVGHMNQWLKEEVQPLLDRLPIGMAHFFGEDFGRTRDRTAIAVGYLDQQLVRKFPFVVELLNTPYEMQALVLMYIVKRLPKFFAGALDATGNGEYLAEAMQLEFGERLIQCVKLNDSWYAQHLPKFKSAFEDALIEVVRDADHLLDLVAFKIIDGIPKLPKAKTQSTDKKMPPRHGDAGIAYLLGHFAANQEPIAYGYESVSRDKSNNVLKMPRSGMRKPGGLL